MPKIVYSKLISRHYNDLLAGYFRIDKTKKLIGKKYYLLSLKKDVESFMKGCDICLASKAVRYKLYDNLQSLFVPNYWWKNFLIDFVTGLPILTNWKDDSYNFILVIVDRHIKMVHYKLFKIIINAPGLGEAILSVVVWHYSLSDLIMSDKNLLFPSKFWSLLCYFLNIK